MANSADFESFLQDINPSGTIISEVSSLHRNLRDHLESHDTYNRVCRRTYLSGSYAKRTFIRPKRDSDGCDIDVIVETTHTTNDSPLSVLIELKEALSDRSCYQNARVQNHSIGIEMSNFHLDVVPLARDDDGFLFIGSSREGSWSRTDPKGHISWSTEVNQAFEGNYKPLVKIMKWWRREHCPQWVKFPKGITLEKMIADNLPETGLSIEECVMQVMANLSDAYSEDIEVHQVPEIKDPAFDGNNLASKYCYEDFAQFVSKLNEHLTLLAEKGTENSTWKVILGDSFPSGSTKSDSVALAKVMSQEVALSVQHRQKLPFPMQTRRPNATITAVVTLPNGESRALDNDGPSIPKGSTVVYKVNCGPIRSGYVKWQVTNTGEEAMGVCRRGGFEVPNEGKTSRREQTAYTGKHYVQCFIVRGGSCVRWSSPFFINVE